MSLFLTVTVLYRQLNKNPVIRISVLSGPEAKFKINVKEGFVELEGKEAFVDRHLDKFEEIFTSAIKEAVRRTLEHNPQPPSQSQELVQPNLQKHLDLPTTKVIKSHNNNRHILKQSPTLPPIPVDLKGSDSKIGLREFYADKKPSNHYEKTVVFVYYLTKFNKEDEIRYGEILSCYEEVDEKKPSITDIVKNSVRYKGWLEYGSDKFSIRLTISGENFVKFDLPHQKKHTLDEPIPPSLSLNNLG
ncbi:MAG TPA: hypothetical protein VE548_10640 [Nitrososphaeraceae archaeon]|nr:hypothetical protein [Nitrososphaeraceae archaeon]